jgi:hypothetical protein
MLRGRETGLSLHFLESNMTRIIAKWITVRIARHADFGGGFIEADLPDTPYHRAYYPVIRAWSQAVEL